MIVKKKWAVCLTAAAVLIGCGSSQLENFVTANPNVNPTSLVISPKPAAKELGETQQFVATASFDNGTTADVTSLVQWSSSNPAVVTINASTGLATSVLPGQVTVKAQAQGFSDTTTMTSSRFISRVSVDSAGVEGNSLSALSGTALSADGRFVAFVSLATNLVAGGTNGAPQVFVRDRQTGVTTLVSVDSAGNQANTGVITAFGMPFITSSVAISADGRFVVFGSLSDNLVAGDTNGSDARGADVFVHDRQTGSTTRVSVDSAGGQGIKPLGSLEDNFFSISADGRFVAFASNFTNLVSGDTNGVPDVFVRDRQTGTTTRVNVDPAGNQILGGGGFPSISGDGRFVAFVSDGPVLGGPIAVFVRDRQAGTTTLDSPSSTGGQPDGGSGIPSISADGRFVAFASEATNLVAGDTNGVPDVFVRDRQTGITTRVTVGPTGIQGNGSGADILGFPTLSADGRLVAFSSDASNLVAGDTNAQRDVFVRDLQSNITTRVNVTSAGFELANSDQTSPHSAISGDGRFVAFSSDATNLVAGDTNEFYDVFVTKR